MNRQISPGESVTVAVVETISTLEDRPPDTLPPLTDALQENLDEIFESGDDGTSTDRIVRVTFEYIDYYVTVESDGTISVEPKPDDPFAI